MYSLIYDGKYRATLLDRDTWKKAAGSQASLQRICNKEGSDIVGDKRVILSARIGIIVNQQNDCFTHNSIIGFGTGGYNSCENEATVEPDNGDKHTRATGYILVQW